MINLYNIYNEYVPDFLMEAAAAAPMIRLQDVGMSCGCEYTKIPAYAGISPYSRYEHSLGVGLIVWHFTGDVAQALAGLFHDVATPTFAHVIDFFNGDHMTQESTEDGTTQIIEQSAGIQQLLLKHGLTTGDVCDYHKYPIADNDSPQLSADRLEYTLANLVNFGFNRKNEVENFYHDLMVGRNEWDSEEIMFRTPETAIAFSEGALKCSKIYGADAARFAAQALADLLKEAVCDSVITEGDFYLTEGVLIEKLKGHPKYLAKWERYCSYSRAWAAEQPCGGGYWMKVFAKKRCIDPFIAGYGRVSQVDREFAKKLEKFTAASQDYWICGE